MSLVVEHNLMLRVSTRLSDAKDSITIGDRRTELVLALRQPIMGCLVVTMSGGGNVLQHFG